MTGYKRVDMVCDACGQRFILVGDRITEHDSPTWRRVLREHASDKHADVVPTVTMRFGGNDETWRITSD